MGPTTTVGLDIAKSVFQIHAIAADGEVVVRRRLKRAQASIGSQTGLCPIFCTDLTGYDLLLGVDTRPTRNHLCFYQHAENTRLKAFVAFQIGVARTPVKLSF